MKRVNLRPSWLAERLENRHWILDGSGDNVADYLLTSSPTDGRAALTPEAIQVKHALNLPPPSVGASSCQLQGCLQEGFHFCEGLTVRLGMIADRRAALDAQQGLASPSS